MTQSLLWEVPLAVLIGVLVVRTVGSAHVGAIALGFIAGAVAGLVAYTFTFGGPAEAFDSGLLAEGGLALLVFGMALLGAAGAGIGYLVGYHRRGGRGTRAAAGSAARGDRIPPRVGP